MNKFFVTYLLTYSPVVDLEELSLLKIRRKLLNAVHVWRGENFRDSSKEHFSDKVYNADQIGM